MSRRVAAVIALGLVAVGASGPASAQPAVKIPRIGVLTPAPCTEDNAAWGFFLQGLRARGYTPGQSILVECRFSDTLDMAQFEKLTAELVRLRVDVIVSISSTALQAVRRVTTIPVAAVDLETDPVAAGLAVSLARPGGNVTGIFLDAAQLNGKWLELLREALPRLKRVAALWDATMDRAPLRATEAVARSLGVHLHVVAIRSPAEIQAALRDATTAGADAVLVMQSPLTDIHGTRVADLALKQRLPTIAMFPTFPSQGGLMSYGPDIRQLYVRMGSYIDRLLKGARPGQLPIERPIHFYLVVNRKTAAALGVVVPHALLLRADHVIDP
jgi:putative ABC transport system substrate-binding protein